MNVNKRNGCPEWGGYMTEKETKRLATEMKRYAKKDETPQEALRFLVKAGICQKNGKLSPRYQG